jgi:hypothetical protein
MKSATTCRSNFSSEHRLISENTITIPVTTHGNCISSCIKALDESSTPVIIRKETDDQDKTLFDSFRVSCQLDCVPLQLNIRVSSSRDPQEKAGKALVSLGHHI